MRPTKFTDSNSAASKSTLDRMPVSGTITLHLKATRNFILTFLEYHPERFRLRHDSTRRQ